MAREVVWTDPAWEDLEVAAEYIARDSEHYAAAFVHEVKDAAASLSEMAERGQIVPEFGDASIRELLVRPLPPRLPAGSTAGHDPCGHPRGPTCVAILIVGSVYVLHASQKKTRRTFRADIELTAERYKSIGAKA